MKKATLLLLMCGVLFQMTVNASKTALVGFPNATELSAMLPVSIINKGDNSRIVVLS